tara:strand:+ start:42 stop:335 length:294 start_codon:yes stop_codon:yes gene_type:complete
MLMGNSVLISRNVNCLSTGSDSETIILNLSTGNYLKLNNTGRKVWDLLENELAYSDLLCQICKDFNTKEHEIDTDLKAFLYECKEKKILDFYDSKGS